MASLWHRCQGPNLVTTFNGRSQCWAPQPSSKASWPWLTLRVSASSNGITTRGELTLVSNMTLCIYTINALPMLLTTHSWSTKNSWGPPCRNKVLKLALIRWPHRNLVRQMLGKILPSEVKDKSPRITREGICHLLLQKIVDQSLAVLISLNLKSWS